MIYQQVPLIRLARAARKLEKDVAWHPFGDDGITYYRVIKRVMQRVRLEDGEDPELYHLLDEIDPLPSRASKEGFHDEVRIVQQGNGYEICNMWLRAYIGWEHLAVAVKPYNSVLIFRGANSIEFRCRLDTFTREDFLRGLLLGRAVSIVGPQLAEDARLGIPHIPSEVKGLLATAYEILLEEMPVRRVSHSSAPDQESLFPM